MDLNYASKIIVGMAYSRAFIIRDCEIQYISKPAGATGIRAEAVNETGDVVGTIFYQDPNNRTEAFLYHNGQLIRGSDLFGGVSGIIQTQGLEVTDDGHVFVLGFDRQFRPTVFELSPGEGPPPGEEQPPGGGGNPSGVP